MKKTYLKNLNFYALMFCFFASSQLQSGFFDTFWKSLDAPPPRYTINFYKDYELSDMAAEYFSEYMKIKIAHDQNHFPPEVLLEKYKNAFLEMAEKEKIENPEKCWQDALLDHNLLSEKKWALLDAHVMAFLTAMALTSEDWKNCTCRKNRDISNKSNMLLIVQSLLNNDYLTIQPHEIEDDTPSFDADKPPEMIKYPLHFVGVKPRNRFYTRLLKDEDLMFLPNRKTPRSSPVCKSTSTTTLFPPS